MKLYEFEGHKILSKAGIESPFFVTCASIEEVREARKRLKFPLLAKLQVLSGKRGKAGGIEIFKTKKKLVEFCRQKFGSEFQGEEVKFINLVQWVKIEEEYYVSITYDTRRKLPFLLFSYRGGVDIEEVKVQDPAAIVKYEINPIRGPAEKDLHKLFGKDEKLVDFVMRLWDAFWRYDCRLVEVNPVAKVTQSVILSDSEGSQDSSPAKRDQNDGYMAIDAKVILDDNGLVRQQGLDVLPKGAIGAIIAKRELEARKIDAEDYRGSAGSTFIELDGDVAILASGGGASLMIMDSVVASGGKCANYTEYSGNPPREKVEKLTKITLSKNGISGCLVAGAVANFTDIFETLSGFAQGLKSVKPKPNYPIVVRRGGPRQKEAYAMLAKFAKKEGFDIHLFGPQTPIPVACKKMVELSNEFKKKIE
ncbi:MAG: Succinyl-CoA synthetase, beta subunit [Candidatus Curtissbacteria bacterium GW2011_GWA1_41_11]|uniref:Succinyl-CoA synthetase, beta subunit n=1 Tax=Candidatus Curtissbacteria bacterium GW2011_GWA1_41_11 TaxID=1618409 RepID=A0A0G0WRB1_9BACT|nr:MAG: Succinyl-CoA synthetase, beta subunit [Candidatus Curtissbacteria bacterium GW2011_GWA1_41_11]